MDRTTEFGSDEYFRKQRALEQAANAAAAAAQNVSPLLNREHIHTRPPTFTLAIGHPRPPTGKRRASQDAVKPSDQKIRSVGHDLSTTRNERRPNFSRPLAGLRSKVPAIQKPFAGHYDDPLAEEPIKRRRTFWQLFDALPIELQIHIISPLPIRTILDLRLVCKSFHKLIAFHEGPIVRHHINHSIPSYALRLYPLPDKSEASLRYFCGIWHRLDVAAKLTTLISDYVTKDLFLRNTKEKREEFEPQYERMHRRLMPLVFTIFHFFEAYRTLHLEHLKSGGIPLSRQPFTVNQIEKQILSTYSDETLLKVHEVYPLVISSFSRRLRVPSYVGKLELMAKGWNGTGPVDEVYLAILMIGGLGQAQRFWQIKGYNDRRHSVDTWYNLVSGTPSQKSSTAISKMSRLSLFHRKRSAAAEVPTFESPATLHEPSICKDWFCVNPSCVELSSSRHRRYNHPEMTNYNSLSAGPPMTPLPREDCQRLLSDPVSLSTTWFATAESEILSRGIVEDINKIKKNTAVLTALISEIQDNELSPNGLLEIWIPPGGYHNTLQRISTENSRGDYDF